MLATASNSWWPAIIILVGGLAWTLACIWVAVRYERHDGPLSFAIIPVLAGFLALVGVVEWIW